MAKPKKQTQKPVPTVHEPQGNEADAAAMFGSVLSLRLHVAAGVLPIELVPDDCRYHGECASTLEEAGVALGVSGRWAQTLRARGMPTLADGRTPIAAAKHWRSQQPEPPAENPLPPPRKASGDLARAFMRLVRIDLPIATGLARQEFLQQLATVDRTDDVAVAELFNAVMAKQLAGFCLADEQIEQVVAECWGIA